MQSIVEDILSGSFNTNENNLSFSTPIIELSVSEETGYEGSFMIYAPSNEYVEGHVSTDSLKIQLPVSEFTGSMVEIPFCINTEGLSSGDEIQSSLRIISNHGEYLLPVHISVLGENLDTSLGDIRNLFHFTNLARSNWAEAVSIFDSYDFEKILSGSEKQYLGLYRALKEGNNLSQNLEEFLLQVKKKQLADFIIKEPSVRLDNVHGEMVCYVEINRNGWGYSELEITTDASFIELHSEFIGDEDFESNYARFSYSIFEEKLHEGRNFGTITLKNVYKEIKVSICVANHPVNRRIADIERATGHLTVDLVHYYEAFRCRKISAGTWMESTDRIINKLCELNPENPQYEMMHAQLLVTQERYNEARWTLEQLEGRIREMKNDDVYCYYYYLTTLVDRTPDNVADVTGLVESMYRNNQSSWRIAWLYSYLAEEYTRFPDKKWALLKEQFDRGNFSPIMYCEGFQIASANPTIISSLGGFEIALLRFMGHKDILTPDIVEQVLSLIKKTNNDNPRLIELLKQCFKVLPTDEVLGTLTELLINSMQHDSEAFSWYEKAVERQLRVNKLYEYYMMSIDLNSPVEIPKIVLMYFAFDSSLDEIHNAYLYSYMMKNRENYPELFNTYSETIERFTMFELLKGHNNRFLSQLYRQILSENVIGEDLAKGLSKALFVHRVIPMAKGIKCVHVMYENAAMDYRYETKGKDEVYIPIYGNNYYIVLEDEQGNRLIRETEYKVERLMLPDKFGSALIGKVNDDILFDMWVCERGRDINPISAFNVESMKRLAVSPYIVLKVKKQITSMLFKFYYDEDRLDELDELLNEVRIEEVPSAFVSELINFFVIRGMYDKAYEWLKYCGTEKVSPKTISRLCAKLLADADIDNMEEDPVLTSLIFQSLEHGKYDDRLCRYLVRFFNGTTRQMKEVFNTAFSLGVESYLIEKRILLQVLYTGTDGQGSFSIFSRMAKRRTDDELVLAFLCMVSYEYFVKECIIEEGFFDILKIFIAEGKTIPLVCKLAYTKLYSESAGSLSETELRWSLLFLKEIILEGMYFPYFKEYAKYVTYMHRFLDKTMIEYRVPEGTKATIHYMIEKADKEENEYVSETMKDMYHGICVKQFVLFFGEKLQYYIVEHKDGEEILTESNIFGCNDMDSHDFSSKYSLINDISIARALGDQGTLDNLLLEYFQNEYILDNLFSMNDT